MAAPSAAIGSKEHFLAVYETIKAELLAATAPAATGLPAEVAEWQAKMVDYNVPGGKLNRGLSVVHACVYWRACSASSRSNLRAR